MQPDEVEIIHPKTASDNHRQIYEKYNTVNAYDNIKQTQISPKKTSDNNPTAFPKLSGKDFTISYTDGSQRTAEIVRVKVGAHPPSRTKVFKSFINRLDEQQKKMNTDTMSLLGLQVKKLSCTEKVRIRRPEKQQQLMQSTLQHWQEDQQGWFFRNEVRNNVVEGTKEMSKYNPVDLLCRKIDITQRDIPSTLRWTQTLGKKSTFRMKERISLKTAGPSKEKKAIPSESTRNIRIDLIEKPEIKKIKILVNPEFVNPIYEGRFSSYRQLIFKLNFAHNVYVEFTKYDEDEVFYIPKSDQKYKAYVGPGNNGKLIISLLKRRFWWTVLEDKKLDSANFVWTQLKVNDFFKKQEPSRFIGNSANIVNFTENAKSQNIERSCSASPTKRRTRIRKDKEKPLPDTKFFYKIFNETESLIYSQKMLKTENKTYPERKQLLNLRTIQNWEVKVHNHLINNFYLGNKKALFYNLKEYYDLLEENPFKKIPLTFHIKKGYRDPNYKRFVAYYKKRHAYMKQQERQMEEGEIVKRKMRNVWIVKPGELTNRGHGITVIDEIYELNSIIKRQDKHENGCQKTFIVQLYLDRPFLYQRRKFDLRHYILITHLHGVMRGYWFDEGYIRTCSYEFDIENFEREIHLTNDSVQKNTPLYGKYEHGNKLSYSDFQRYLDATYRKKKYSLAKTVLPQMKSISLDAIKSSFLKLSPQRLKHNFEIFGLDFMIDCDFKPWLIEINTNPCLDISCPLLARLIPQMLDQAFRLSLDVIFPPPCHYPNTAKHLVPEAGLQNLKFQLIFQEKRDGPEIRSLYKKNSPNDLLEEIGDISEDEVYQDDGKDVILDEFLNL